MIDTEEFEDGRFDGDLMAVLQHNSSEPKRPFRVLVFEWRYPRGPVPFGATVTGTWQPLHPFFHRFYPVSSFKRLESAVRYQSKVHRFADFGYYRRTVGESRNEGFVTL